jgi:signal transduction histidine kinase
MSTSAPPADPRNEDSMEPHRLVEEQAALRRVATLVASGAPSAEVFSAVAQEVSQVMHMPMVGVYRYDSDGLMTVVATWSDRPHVLQPGTRWPLEGQSMVAQVHRTGRPARVEDYSRLTGALAAGARESALGATAGAPIIVNGSVWGAMGMSSPDAPLPDHAEDRLAAFTELVATAIANTQAHEELAQLAEEQAALRRVATLVAAGAPPLKVFEAVSAEVAALIDADGSALSRYEEDGTVTALSGWTRDGTYTYVGAGYAREGTVSGVIFETGQPGRVDSYAAAPGHAPAAARAMSWRSSVGAPITVDGRLWGALSVATKREEPLPPDAEQRLVAFTELVATAIANAESRAELDASRARIVATADATRRRIERDLHDGAQQELVWLALALRAAQSTVPEELEQHRSELGRVVDGLTLALDNLREIALGIHPAGLSEDGLMPALKRLVARSPLRVNLDCRADGRFPEPVEVAAYYVVSESLTNAAKYAGTTVVDVAVAADGGSLRVHVRDHGCGGADPAEGSGLLGLRDRVEAIGGTMRLASPPGTGTSLDVELPLVDDTAPC